MKRIAAITLVSLLGLGSQYLSAGELPDILGPELAAELGSSEKVTRVQLKDPAPQLLPKDAFGQSLVQAVAAELDPSLMVETLYAYPKPSAAQGHGWSEAERTGLYNASRSLSTLEGIEYYSASRKKMRTFYAKSSVIADPETKTVLPDPVVTLPPESSVLFARQEDLTFGDNLYRYEYRSAPGVIAFIQANLTGMNYKFVPILGKERLRTVVLVIDTDSSLLVYVVSMARAVLLPGIEGKVRDSFSNRSDAMYHWFSSRADAAFAAAGR